MSNVNSLRVFATFLLVAYHVIGTGPDGGMQVEAGSGWRIFADAMIDLRMPLFACIAGYAFALRPFEIGDAVGFFQRKFHRLVVPGLVASLIFWIVGNTLFGGSFATGAPLIEILTLSNGHFWFLQALLVIFLCLGLADALLGRAGAVPLLAICIAATLLWDQVPSGAFGPMGLNAAVYLSPYFMFGMVMSRHGDVLRRLSRPATVIAAAALMAGIVLNIGIYLETGALSRARFDTQSLAFGLGAIFLLFRFFPVIGFLDRLAIFSFVIYLYHPFGTSAARRGLSALEIGGGWLGFVLGIAAGVGVPLAIYFCARRSALMSEVILGLRRRVAAPVSSQPAPVAGTR